MSQEYISLILFNSNVISTAWTKIKDVLKEEAVNPSDLDLMFMVVEIKVNENQYTSFKELQDDISHTLLQNAENFNIQSVDSIIQQMTPTKRATTFHCPICQIEMFTLREMMSHIEKCSSTGVAAQEQSQQSPSQQTPPPPKQKPQQNVNGNKKDETTTATAAVIVEEGEEGEDNENIEYDGESIVYSQLFPYKKEKENNNISNNDNDFPTYSLDLSQQSQPLQQQQENNNPESDITQTPSPPPKQIQTLEKEKEKELINNNNNNNIHSSKLIKRKLFNTNDSSCSSSNDASSEDENNDNDNNSPPIKTKSQQYNNNNNNNNKTIITPLKNKSFTIPIISPSPSPSPLSSNKNTPSKTLKNKRKKNNKQIEKNISQLSTQSPPKYNNNNSNIQTVNYSQLSTQSTMINIATPSPPPQITRKLPIINDNISSSPSQQQQQQQQQQQSQKHSINYSMPLNFFLVPPTVKRRKLDGCETQKITREYIDYDENGNEVEIEENIEIKIVRKIKQPN